jgi:hypothetical protein
VICVSFGVENLRGWARLFKMALPLRRERTGSQNKKRRKTAAFEIVSCCHIRSQASAANDGLVVVRADPAGFDAGSDFQSLDGRGGFHFSVLSLFFL